MTKTKKMKKRFYKRFVTKCSDCDLLKDVEPSRVINFIQSEIDLEVVEERKSIVEMIKEHRKHVNIFSTETGDRFVMDVLSLITKAESTSPKQ